MKKTLISLLLVLVMTFGVVAYAETAEESNNYVDTFWRMSEELQITVDGQELRFVAKYDMEHPMIYGGHVFVVGYVPEGVDSDSVSVWKELDYRNFFLMPEDGAYVLYVSENALLRAYELWLETIR